MTTAAAVAPLSVDEMLAMLNGCNVTPIERERAIATAAGLERVTNWIVARERDAGKDPIQALKTVGQAFGGGT
jgi:hypothetical protein